MGNTMQIAEGAAKGNQVKTAWKTDKGFHQDNSSAHGSVLAIAVRDCGLNWLITLHILLI